MTSYSALIPGMEPGTQCAVACIMEEMNRLLLRVMTKIQEDHRGSQDEFLDLLHPGDAEDSCRMKGSG